jgi:hypothetical protein
VVICARLLRSKRRWRITTFISSSSAFGRSALQNKEKIIEHFKND